MITTSIEVHYFLPSSIIEYQLTVIELQGHNNGNTRHMKKTTMQETK